MSVTQVLILAVIAVVINQFKQERSLALLCVSALVIYWIQPIQEPVNLTFWLSTFTLALTVVILVDLNRYFQSLLSTVCP